MASCRVAKLPSLTTAVILWCLGGNVGHTMASDWLHTRTETGETRRVAVTSDDTTSPVLIVIVI